MMRTTQKPLAIAIPSLGTRSSLDRAIQSALDAAPSFVKEVVVSVNGFETKITSSSKFRQDPRVTWRFSSTATVPHWKSYSRAVENCDSRWVILLSDDDILMPTLTECLSNFPWSNEKALFATHVKIKNAALGELEGKKPPEKLAGGDILRAHFDRQFHHHLSLFMFPKSLYREVGGYVPNEYPNGLFVDTVLHAWLCSRSEMLVGASVPVVTRFETDGQSSATFEIGRKVNRLMESVIDAHLRDEYFASRAMEYFGNRRRFFEHELLRRFGTEWTKLGNPAFGASKSLKIKLLYSFLTAWRINPRKKIRFFLRWASARLLSTLRRGFHLCT